jgi:hypothetical protein
LVIHALGGQRLSAFDRPIIAKGLALAAVERALLCVGGLRPRRAQAVQEVGVLAVSITVVSYHLLKLNIFDVVMAPFIVIVRALSFLQFVQKDLILIYNLRKAANPICSVQRVVGIESLSSVRGRIKRGSGLSRSWSATSARRVNPGQAFGAACVERWFQIYLEHFFEQNSVLVLDFAHAFHFIELLLIIIDDVLWLRRFLHVDAWLDSPEPLHVHKMLLHLFPISNQPIGPTLVPHCYLIII